MPSYKLEIVVEGKDRGASGVLGKVSSGLGGIAKIALGSALGIGLANIGSKLMGLVGGGVQAAASMQDLTLALETLAAKEIARGDEVTRTSQKVIHLTEEEKQEVEKLQLKYGTLGARIREAQENLGKLTEKYGEHGAKTDTARARLAELENQYSDLGREITTLTSKEGAVETVLSKVTVNTVELSEALKLAAPKALELKNQLRDLSIVSPFEYEQVSDMLRFSLAMGSTVERTAAFDAALKKLKVQLRGNQGPAMALTEAALNTGAALGLSGEMMNRLSFNLLQAIGAGDLTAANMRQLKMVGLDLADVFEYSLGKSIKQVDAELKSGQLTMEEVSVAFIKYAQDNFGGAAERMSKTFHGLQSSIHDLFFFAGADLLTPLLEKVTEKLGGLFDKARGVLESGKLAEIGQQLAEGFDRALEWLGDVGKLLSPFKVAFGELMEGNFNVFLSDFALGIGNLAKELLGLDDAHAHEVSVSVYEIGQAAKEGITGVADFLGELAKTAYQKAMQWWTDHGPEVKTAIKELGEKALTAAGNAAELFSALAVTGWQTSLAWWSTDGPAITGSIKKMGGALGTFADALGRLLGEEKTGNMAGLGQMFADIDDPTTLDKMVDAFQDFQQLKLEGVTEDMEALGTVFTVISGLLTPLVDGLGSLKSELGDAGFEIGVKDLVTAFEKITLPITTLSGFINDLAESIETLKTQIEKAGGVPEFFDKVGEQMTALWENPDVQRVIGLFERIFTIWDKDRGSVEASSVEFGLAITKIFAGLADKLVGHSIIPDMIDDVVDEFGRLAGDATKAIDLSKFVSAGKNIVGGLRQGIEDKWESFTSWLMGKLEGMLDQILAFFGIHSASTVMADVSRDLVGGLRVGWGETFGKFRADVGKSLAGLSFGGGGQSLFGPAMAPAMASGLATAGGRQGAAGGGVDMTQVAGDTYHVYVNDRATAALMVQMMQERRGARLGSRMGG